MRLLSKIALSEADAPSEMIANIDDVRQEDKLALTGNHSAIIIGAVKNCRTANWHDDDLHWKGRRYIMGIFAEFLKHPRRIGAIAPSGKHLAAKMMTPIDFASAKVIVEYGPGTGSFTKELVTRRRSDTTLILIEQNKTFYEQLKASFGGQPDLFIVHGSAANVGQYLEACGVPGADYIVSGLPFSSLPAAVSDQILNATKPALGQDGKFITFQYSLVKKKFFEQYFQMTDCWKVIKNLPPAFVLVMKNYGG